MDFEKNISIILPNFAGRTSYLACGRVVPSPTLSGYDSSPAAPVTCRTIQATKLPLCWLPYKTVT